MRLEKDRLQATKSSKHRGLTMGAAWPRCAAFISCINSHAFFFQSGNSGDIGTKKIGRNP